MMNYYLRIQFPQHSRYECKSNPHKFARNAECCVRIDLSNAMLHGTYVVRPTHSVEQVREHLG